MARTKKSQPVAPVTPEPPAKLNPRTEKSRAKLARAIELIASRLESGEWVSSNDLHDEFRSEIPEGMFGRVKSALAIQHRRVKPANGGRAYYEWRLVK